MYFDERENNLKYENEDIDNYVKYEDKDINNYLKYEDKDYNQINKEIYKVKDNNVYDISNVTVNNFRHSVISDLNSPKDGLNKGNMFNNIYDPYKNYMYKVIVRGDKDESLLKVQELTFALKDLNLYLDVHPSDIAMFEKFKMIAKDLEESKKKYERKYGPLSVECTDGNSFDWINNPWPWDKGGRN